MADIPCPNHPDQEAAIGVMVYGPEGGTTDMCPTCLLSWAVTIVEGAGATVLVPGEGAAQTAQEAPDGSGSTGGRRRGKQRQEAPPAPAEGAEPEVAQDPQVAGAEH